MQIISGARGRITSPFGAENVPGANVRVHKGMDRGHGDSTPDDLAVYAPADGKVASVAREGTYGYRIIIDHGNGYTSLLAHLSNWTVREGDRVKQGDLIATMGNTGTIYVHLHQELRYRGVPVNPELYLIRPVITPPEIIKRSIDMATPLVYLHTTNGGKDRQFYIFDVELEQPIPLPGGTPAYVAARAFGQDEDEIPTFSDLEGTDMLRNLARDYRDARDRARAADVKRRGTYAA